MFSNEPREIYEKNQLVNVICQLRFPKILSIGAKEPYEFQEEIRREFPRYSVRTEQPAPKPVVTNGVVTMEKQEPVKNHSFSTLDGSAVVNLTDSFLSLTVSSYRDWETFAGMLDKPVAAFCKIYEPACFERIGLRYLNAFSKEELSLQSCRWADLLQPGYVGLLDEDDVNDESFSRCTQDAEFKAPGGCRVKLHVGPGMIKRGGVQEKTPRYILDIDVFMGGQIPPQHLTGGLQTAHLNAWRVFRGAISEELHEALESLA